jgi:CheY-like chemotaxis protein
LTTTIEGELPRVRGNTNQLIQTLLNLFRNAEDAVGVMEQDRPPAIHVAVAANGDVVFIDIVDNGPGILREAHATIFEPFYSTKAAGAGTGLGLTVGDALATIAAATKGDFDLLLLDARMPGGGGAEAFRQLQTLSPGLVLKTVSMTGELSLDMAGVAGDGYAAIVQKPFLIEQLMHTQIDIIHSDASDD